MISPNHKDVMKGNISINVYEKHVAHYLQVTQVRF
jgi:hypothetical protein